MVALRQYKLDVPQNLIPDSVHFNMITERAAKRNAGEASSASPPVESEDAAAPLEGEDEGEVVPSVAPVEEDSHTPPTPAPGPFRLRPQAAEFIPPGPPREKTPQELRAELREGSIPDLGGPPCPHLMFELNIWAKGKPISTGCRVPGHLAWLGRSADWEWRDRVARREAEREWWRRNGRQRSMFRELFEGMRMKKEAEAEEVRSDQDEDGSA